ncbi:MAG: hypothetical protein COA32_02210 [Fluviicola sp.]|nr:MAG: hypothetical protein COA32_02210 [Fluviicola sp.]
MKKIILFISVFLIPVIAYTQEKGALGVEFSANRNQYSMDEFNESVDNVNSNSSLILTSNEFSEITSGMGYGLSINLQLSDYFNVGVYGDYFLGKSENEFMYISGGEFGTPIDTSYWTRHFEVNSLILGLKSSFFISKSAFWKKYDWLSNVESTIDVGVGYSFSSSIFYNIIKDKVMGTGKEINKVTGIHLKSQFKIGYIISKNTHFSSIGLKIGYQYLQTSQLKGGEFSYFFSEENAPRLNFSGLTAGIYLTFGK